MSNIGSDLFQQDNVREGVSLDTLKKWGGYRGLEKLLRTNLKVSTIMIQAGIEFTIEDKAKR